MAVLCREKEYLLLRRLLGAQQLESGNPKVPSLIFLHGGPQTGKKLLVSSVLKSLQSSQESRKKSVHKTKVRTALLSCHLGSFGSSALFEELWRQISSCENNQSDKKMQQNETESNVDMGASSTNNLAEFIFKLKKISQQDALLNTSSLTIIGLANAEMLRTLEPTVLPGLIRLSSIVKSRLNPNNSQSICVVLMSRLPWSKCELESTLNSSPVTVKLEPYSKDNLAKLLTEYLVCNSDRLIKEQCDTSEEAQLTDDFFRTFSDVILGTFHAVAKTFPQFVSAAKMVLPTYMKPIEEKKVEFDNSRALYRHVEPFLKKWLTTANLKEACGQNFEAQMRINMRSYDHNPSLDGNMIREEPKVVSRLNVELPFLTKFLLIAAYIASYNPVKSDKRFFMKHHGKFKKSVRQSASLAAHKRSSQLLGPKQFPLDRMLNIFYVIADIKDEDLGCDGGPSTDILSQVSSLVSLNLLCHIESAGLDTPKYKCNVSLDFIKLMSKNVRFEIHKYLYDINI